MMQRYYFSCNHVSFSNGFWVSVLRPPPQGLSVAPRYGKADYKSKTTIDGYINPRFTIKYKMVVASVGYFYWARKFKFSKSDGAIGGVNLSLGCAF